MSCFAPVTAWYRKEVVKGKRQITFNRSLAHFPTPLKLPCGKCVGCLQARAKQWALRCDHERKLHKENCFLTLTYDPEKIPKGHTLVKRDLQLFMKRLRKYLEPKKVRYYACGEYGEKSGRPHYHILLFGWSPDAKDRRVLRKSKSGDDLYNSVTLNRLWPNGHCVLGNVSPGSILYVASYISKDTGRFRKSRVVQTADGSRIEQIPPFALMSRNPGIGSGYVGKYGSELMAHDTVVSNGREVRFPRYYDGQLIKGGYQTEKGLLEIKDSRRREVQKSTPKKENYPDRRRTREKYEILKLKHFKKGDI